MFLQFFTNLRDAKVPVSLREYLSFLEAMDASLVLYDVEGFYYLARAIMVKDERNLDKFDQAFSATFSGLETMTVDDIMNAVDVPVRQAYSHWDSLGNLNVSPAFSLSQRQKAVASCHEMRTTG